MQTNPESTQMTRREFLVGVGKAGLGLTLATLFGCSPSPEPIPPPVAPVTPSGPRVIPIETPPGADTKITGEVPGEYSPFIRNNHLQARVLGENEGRVERVQAGFDYLKKLQRALQEGGNHGPRLADYGVNSTENYPIDLDNWTIYDYIDTFLKEYNSDTIKIVSREYDGAIVSTNSEAEFAVGKFKRKATTIYANSLLDRDKTYIQQESAASHYQGRTDIEMALAIIHEYGHTRQYEAGLNYINGDPKRINDTSNALRDFTRMRSEAAQNAVINRIPRNQPERNKIIGNIRKVDFKELQPDSIAYITLDFLNQLNQSSRFPGTRRRNPEFPYNIGATQKRYPDQYSQDQYRLFEKTAKVTSDVLNPEWVVGWGGYRYP